MLGSLGGEDCATRRVGWPQLQEGRSRRQKSDLAHSCMQHPLGNTFSCSLMFTNETWVPKRTWVKTVAGIPRITLTLLIQISPGIWLELICISSQGLIRIRVIGMVAEGRRQKARVWSLLNNPGHCPAPPKATHSISFPCPHTQVITLPHSPAISQVPGPTVTDQGPCSTMKLSNIMDKATCPFSHSLPASRKKKQSNKSVWMVSGYVQKKKKMGGRKKERKRKAKTQTSQCQNFSLKIQSLEEGRNYFCLSPPALHLPGWASKSLSISGTPPLPVPHPPPQSSLSPLLTASAHNIQAGAQPLPAWFPLLQRDVAQATPVAPPPESPVVHDRVQPVKAASQPLPPGTARPKARAQAPSCDRQKGAQADIRVLPLFAGARDSRLGYRQAPQRLRARRPPSAARGRCTPRTASSPLAAPSRASAPPRPRVSLAPTSWCPARLLFHATGRYPRRPGELTFAAGAIHRGYPGARHGVAV